MSTGHAAGPWHTVAARTLIHLHDSRGYFGISLPGATDESKANAALIAAAPELLEALKGALSTIDALWQDVQGFREKFGDHAGYDVGEAEATLNETLTHARAAITKTHGARGT